MSIRIAIYFNEVFVRFRDFATVERLNNALAGRAQELTVYRVIEDARPALLENQFHITNAPILGVDTDVETGLPIYRITYSVGTLPQGDITLIRLSNLQSVWQAEQEKHIPSGQAISIMAAALHVLCRECAQAGVLTNLSTEETAAVTRANQNGKKILDNYATYKNYETQINAGGNPDTSIGWAAV